MHWRKFAIAAIPLENQDLFDNWLRDRWYEKDALLEGYKETGRFPGEKSAIQGGATKSPEDEFIETEVKLASSWEILNIYSVLGAFGMVFWLLIRTWPAIWAAK
jgi:lysocardiolipin and lysophospholipid acyltransferase